MKSFDDWSAQVGALDACALTHLKLDINNSLIEGDGSILACHSTSEALHKFCKENPKYYIGTMTLTDEDDDSMTFCYENRYHFVNREKYYLCTKNEEKLISFCENSEDL